MSVTDQLLKNNASYSAGFANGGLPMPPAKKVAVLACMDARLDVHKILGLEEGDAHVIRNAGGVATDDAIRSLVISQRLLGTEEIVLIHHTDCGMLTFRDDELKSEIEKETGIRPQFAMEAFGDLEADVRQSMGRIEASPFIPRKTKVRGFVYDVKSGKLNEVKVAASRSRFSTVLPFVSSGCRQPVFEGAASFSALTWSPGGRWLAIGWPAADQLVFVRIGTPPKLDAVSNVSAQFLARTFPGIAGWSR
jgi:carbonic anhydrase